jgi:hypothetical protein
LPCRLWRYVNVERAFGFVQAEDELVKGFIRGTILSLYLSFVYLFLPSIVLFFHSLNPLSVLGIFFLCDNPVFLCQFPKLISQPPFKVVADLSYTDLGLRLTCFTHFQAVF